MASNKKILSDFNLSEKTLLDNLKQDNFVSKFYTKLQQLNTDNHFKENHREFSGKQL